MTDADTTPQPSDDVRERARGVLLGQAVGDALGTTVEFMTPEEITARYPHGHREIVGGGPFNLRRGQITDDTELALAMARAIVRAGRYDIDEVAAAYLDWHASGPFDIGMTIHAAFGRDVGRGPGTGERVAAEARRSNSQANGSLMRASPLAVYGWQLDRGALAGLAAADSHLSHPSRVCVDACRVFALTIADAIRLGLPPAAAYEVALEVAAAIGAEEPVRAAVAAASNAPPADYVSQQGWVLIALQNAFYQLLHADGFEQALIATVNAGGDTDTNGCIAGALLGAVHGVAGIPPRWSEPVLTCETDRGPEYQSTDLFELADALVSATVESPS